MRAVIVAGGRGTRARDLTGDVIPKALLPVAGVPVIVRQMRVLAREGVTRITVLAGHLGGQLERALAPEAAALGVALDVRIEDRPLGTAGCLGALRGIEENTLIVFGDIVFDIALPPLVDFHRLHGAELTAVVHPNDHPRTSDLFVTRDDMVTAVLPHGVPRDDARNLVPAAIYLASPAFFARVPQGVQSELVRDLLPSLVAAGVRIAAYNTPEYFRDAGTPQRHAMAERDLAAGLPEALNAGHKRPAIFFDVDGVLNEEPGIDGVLRPDQVVLVSGAGEAVASARKARQLAVGITNRPQVARGDISFDELDRILGRLEGLLADAGGVLDRIYFCPHHPDRGFPGEVAALKIACECRKPGALMFQWAARDLPVDMTRSASIGDSLRDIGAARRAGVHAYGVRTGYGCRDAARYPGGPEAAPTPDLMFADVREAAAFCVGYRDMAQPIVAALRALPQTPVIVALCGRSGSGKSVLAHALARTLNEDGRPALHVRLDGWIVPADRREPGMTAEQRNRVDALPGVVAALRAGGTAEAPGYEAQSRGAGRPSRYDAGGRPVIILDGIFAAHPAIRQAVDLAVFVAAPEGAARTRFDAFYRWKGFADAAIDDLWRARMNDEWPQVDAQRASADLVLTGAEGQ
jgi:histidinol-phosphate phosphatase family protein